MKIGTGQIPEHEEGKHLPVVWFSCPRGHLLSTQKASGAMMLCGDCRQDDSESPQITVPDRTPERLARPLATARMRTPAAVAVSPPRVRAPRLAECSGCHGTHPAPEDTGGQPAGWLSMSVAAKQEATRNGKPYIWAGTWCSVACLAASIPGLARAERTARQRTPAAIPRPVQDNVMRLMTGIPRGR